MGSFNFHQAYTNYTRGITRVTIDTQVADLDLIIDKTIENFLKFKIDKINLVLDSDKLICEYGNSNFSNENYFFFSLKRSIKFEEELRCYGVIIKFDENLIDAVNEFSEQLDDRKEISSWIRSIKNSIGFLKANGLEYIGIELRCEEWEIR